MSRILIMVVLVMVMVSLLSVWFYPSLQDFMATNATWNGIKGFSSEFKAEVLESISSLKNLSSEAEKAALISIPTLDYNEEDLLIIRNFINDGGTLLLIDDYGHANTILSYLDIDIRFSEAPLLDPLFSYKNQKIPRITDFIPELKEAGINVLMFNNATALLNVLEPEAIAWSSKASFLDKDGNGVLSPRDSRGPLAVAAQVTLGKGKVIMISDPSIIINSMVGRDNNYDFIKYITSHDGESKQILIDGSHLGKAPLDTAKRMLSDAKKSLSNPYALIGLMAFVFIAVYRYTLWGGKSAGR